MSTSEYTFVAEIISANRITIPKNIRKLMNTHKGHLVRVTIKPIKEVSS